MRKHDGYTSKQEHFDLFDMICEEIGKISNITMDEIISPIRTPDLTEARSVVIKILTEHGLSTTEIGHLINRDHSTVIYGRNQNKKLVEDRFMIALQNRLIADINKEKINGIIAFYESEIKHLKSKLK